MTMATMDCSIWPGSAAVRGRAGSADSCPGATSRAGDVSDPCRELAARSARTVGEGVRGGGKGDIRRVHELSSTTTK